MSKLRVSQIQGLVPNNRVDVVSGSTFRVEGDVTIGGTTGVDLPAGRGRERSNDARIGALRFNTDKSRLEFFDSNGWSTGPTYNSDYSNGLQLALVSADYNNISSGNWYDQSGVTPQQQITVTGAGTPAYNNNQKYFEFNSGQQILFDGLASRVNTDAGTVAAWVRFDAIDTNRVVVAYGGNNTDKGFLLQVENNTANKIGFVTYSNPGLRSQAYTGNTVSSSFVGQWIFLVGAYDLTTTTCYINGVQRAEGTNASESLQTQSTFRIGNESGRSYYLDGGLGGVWYWNRRLSADEIYGMYRMTGRHGGFL